MKVMLKTIFIPVIIVKYYSHINTFTESYTIYSTRSKGYDPRCAENFKHKNHFVFMFVTDIVFRYKSVKQV